MTVNTVLNIRFQIPTAESDNELKARLLCQYPKAMTRARHGTYPYETYEVCRLFRIETEDERGLKEFCVELGQGLGATTEVGVLIDTDWWNRLFCSDEQKTLDRLNELSSLIFDPDVVPLNQLRWFMLSWVCGWLEPAEDENVCTEYFRFYINMPETELRVTAYHKLSNLFFRNATVQLTQPDRPMTRYNFREEFEADYECFVASDQIKPSEPFVENSRLFNRFRCGPVHVANRMRSLESKIEQLDKVLVEQSGIDKYNQEITKRNQELDQNEEPVTRDQLENLRDACFTYQQEIRTHLPDHWIVWIEEKKILDSLVAQFWVTTETAVRHLLKAFNARYPDARILQQVGYCRGVKTFVLAFRILQIVDNHDEWGALREFSKECLDVNVTGGVVWPVHSGDWDSSCDGIADFSAENMAWEVTKLAYDPHAAPVEGLRAALIYDVLINRGNDRLEPSKEQYESIVCFGSASEGFLREAGYQMLHDYAIWTIDDYGQDPIADDHERFVMNGYQEESGAFLRGSVILRINHVTLRDAMRHMDVKPRELDPEEADLFDKMLQSLTDISETVEPDSEDASQENETTVIITNIVDCDGIVGHRLIPPSGPPSK